MNPETKATLTLRECAPIIGISQSSMYAAAKKGDLPFPVIKIGGRYVVPTKPFLKALDLDSIPDVETAGVA